MGLSKATKNQDGLCYEPMILSIIGIERYCLVERLCFNPGQSLDKAWNMMSLSANLHDLWSNAHFGLKCLEIQPMIDVPSKKRLELEFHWINVYKGKASEMEISLEALRNMLKDASKLPYDEIPTVVGPESHRRLLTGHLFYIEVEAEKADNMKLMFDVQWAMLRIAAMSGMAATQHL